MRQVRVGHVLQQRHSGQVTPGIAWSTSMLPAAWLTHMGEGQSQGEGFHNDNSNARIWLDKATPAYNLTKQVHTDSA